MQRIATWLQIISALGVLGGLILVILQLQQNEELLRFQIAADLNVNRDNQRKVVQGEEFSTTLSKLQVSPGELTDEELIEFEAYATSIVYELEFRRMLAREGIFRGDWRDWHVTESCGVLDNEVGAAWLAYHEARGSEQEMVDELRRRNAACGDSFLQTYRKTP